MKKMLVLSFVICGLWLAISSANAQAPSASDSRVLATINDTPITVDEFMYVYTKNNQNDNVEKETIDQYLERYINFRLKVMEAEAAQMDTSEAFTKELAGYRAQATPKFLRDSQAIDSMVRLSYYRMTHLRRAASIAIKCPGTASDSERIAAEKQIEELRVRATTGLTVQKKVKKKMQTIQQPKEDFYELAATYSTEQSIRENKGEIGWITPFRYVYSFEDAVYTTPVGEVTPVFRTPYGYHIALVEEEEVTQEVHAAHIMKAIPQPEAEAKAKQAIDSIYQLLMNGAAFEALAKTCSDDKGSALRGGDLGQFSKGMMVKPFEDMVFSMAEGTISQPFKSMFGWHIVKLYEKQNIQPLDSLREQIMRKVQRDERMLEAEKAFIQKTKREYNLPDTMSDEHVMQYADAHLEEKYPEFKSLVQEYHDGILLFDISLQKVWDKASKDTTGLKAYFQQNKNNYTWDKPRYRGYMIYAKDKEAAKRAELIVKTVAPDSINSFIAQHINNDSVQLVKVVKGIWEQGKDAAVDKYAFKLKKTAYTPKEQFPLVSACKGKVLKRPELYTDVLRQVVSDYQDALEQEWLKELKNKYTIKIHSDVLESLR